MAITQGANPEQLRALAKAVALRAGQLEGSGRSLEVLIASMPWRGLDAEQLRGVWQRQHRPELVRLVGVLRTQATTLLENAAAQERTSAELAGGSGGGSAVGPPVRTRETAVPSVEDLQKDVAVSRTKDTVEIKASAKVPLRAINLGGEGAYRLSRETTVNADGTATTVCKLVNSSGATVGVGVIGTAEVNGGLRLEADGTFKLTFPDRAAAERYERALLDRLEIDSFEEAGGALRDPFGYLTDALDHAADASGAKQEVLVKGSAALTGDGTLELMEDLASVDGSRDLAVAVEKNLSTGATTASFKTSGELTAEVGAGRFKAAGEAEVALKLDRENSVTALDLTLKGQFQGGVAEGFGVVHGKVTGGDEAVMKVSIANSPENRALVERYLGNVANGRLAEVTADFAAIYRAGDVVLTANDVSTTEGGYKQTVADVAKVSVGVKHETAEASKVFRKLPGETSFTRVPLEENR